MTIRLGLVLMMGCGLATGQAVATTASSQVEPAVSSLKQAMQTMTVDRWKAPKPLKDAAAVNLNSIRKDVLETLPRLLGAADAAPASVAAALPVERNLAALYDVVLRVYVVADAAAPPEQTAAMEDAMRKLEGVRRSFGDALQDQADGQERQVVALQKAASAPVVVAAPACPAVVAAPKKAVKKPAPPPA